MSGSALAVALAPSIHETAQQVYVAHRAITDESVQELLRRFSREDQLVELQQWACRQLLDRARLRANHAVYTVAHGLTERLTVEDPPAGYREPTQWGGAVTPARFVAPRRLADGGGLKVPRAALRTILKLQVKIGTGRAIAVEVMKKPDILRAADQLEMQGRGCLENSALLKALASEMLDGESARQTVRRLERE